MSPCPNIARGGALPALLAVAVTAGLVTGASTANAASAPRSPQQSETWSLLDTWRPSYGPSSMLEPAGVDAAADGILYVADMGHRRIVVIDAAGSLVGTMGSPADLEQPTDVAVDADRDRVIVADLGGRRLVVYSRTGAPVGQWRAAGPEEAFVPHSVAVDEVSGDVYALSSGLVPRVERFSADGTWIAGWGSLGLGTGQFVSPSDIAVDGAQRVLVADGGSGRVQVFNSSGASLGQWSGLLGITALDTDAATARVYALAGSTADRVVILSATGTVAATLVSRDLPPNSQWHPGRGLATTGAGTVAITTGFGGSLRDHGVRRYSLEPLALQQAVTGDPATGDGFVHPTAIDAHPDGSVVVLDSPARLMRRYDSGRQLMTTAVSGLGEELAVGPGGEVYVTDLRRSVTLRRFQPSGAWDWDKACSCLSGMGLAATATHVYATDALSSSVQVFDLIPSRQTPVDSLRSPEPSYAWPLDLDLAPDGNLWVVDSLASSVQVIDTATKAVQATYALPSHGGRISIAPDGTAFVLLLDGTVAALTPSGTLIDRWPVMPTSAGSAVRAADIAAGTSGRVYVLDDVSGAILVYAPAPDPGPDPDPPPACASSGDKTAQPASVSIGDPVTVTLSLEIACAGGTGADVFLILDRSSSMAGAGCSKLCEAKAAAANFVSNLDLSKHRVGVVSFAHTAVLELGLTDDGPTILAAIQGILPAGNTDIAAALALASDQVAAHARPGSLPVYLLLTDGDPSGTEQAFVDSIREALRSRDTGGVLYSVGLGANVNAQLLTTLSGSAQRYFYAPSAAELGPIYTRIADSIAAIEATDLRITDELGPDVEYIAGSGTGNPRLDGRQLIWDIGVPPVGGLILTYQVRPNIAGRLPTNVLADASYQVAGSPQRFVFPVPEIDVAAPATPTATSTPPPTATITPTPRPTTTARPNPAAVYLPVTMKSVCLARDRARGTDVVLVLDTSSSMEGAKVAAAVAAARTFVGAVDPARDRVGVVTFDVTSRLVYLLTGDLTAVQRSLDSLGTAQGTRIDLGLDAALLEITRRGRVGSQPVIVLLSDGRPTGGTEARVMAAAAEARSRGVTTFAIGLGADVDPHLMRQMASAPENYLAAPSASDLERIYRGVAERLPCR